MSEIEPITSRTFTVTFDASEFDQLAELMNIPKGVLPSQVEFEAFLKSNLTEFASLQRAFFSLKGLYDVVYDARKRAERAFYIESDMNRDLIEAVRAVKKVIDSGIEVRFLGDQISFGEAIEKCRIALEKAAPPQSATEENRK